MSAVPFRLQPCENPTEASLDALTFGDPSLYEKLLTLNRVEILAENPRVRAGTIWFKVDREYAFVEAVAIRSGMYPLVYKVLPEMMAAQLGFSFVGRYFNMSYGYATRSLVWDEKNITENGARSFASVYPGMVPIVKLTAIVAGTERTPVLIREDYDAAAAAADAAYLSDPTLANKLADVARLAVITGSEGNRAGTIWYFRNGNYCFVIASAFRPETSPEVIRLAPLLAAQRFGFSFVGNYTAIPADLKDKALCWDRYTGTTIPELAPLSERLPGVQDFVVTFADSPPSNPNPEPDPWPPAVCDSPEDHRYSEGWNYDGCHWSYEASPGSDYSWSSNSDGLGGSWNYNPPSCDSPEDHRWQSGWNWDGCHWSENSSPGSDYSWSSNSDGLGGSWNYNPPYNPNNDPEAHRYQSGWNWDGSTWSENPYPSDGNSYNWQSNGDGLGGYWQPA